MTNHEIEKMAMECAEDLIGNLDTAYSGDIGMAIDSFKSGYLKGVESLRKENEKLRKQLEIAKEALKYMSRVTYGTELCNTEEENNEILARHFFHNQSKTRQALEQIEKLEQLLSSEGRKLDE